MKDRQEKEGRLTSKEGNPYRLVISTQVIEVSLDVVLMLCSRVRAYRQPGAEGGKV